MQSLKSSTLSARSSCRGVSLKAAVPAPRVIVHRMPTLAVKSNDAENPSVSASTNPFLLGGSTLLFTYMLDTSAALAAQGEFGLLEGRTAALVHPAMMFTFLASSLYAAYLGIQWRKTREIGEEIRTLKKLLPVIAADGTMPISPITAQVESMETKRKELIAGNYKDRHSTMGSIILAGGVGIAIEGATNTWMRTGKLFPGDHLFFGAAMVVMWAAAAALVPAMQKGNNTARTAHIALNSTNTLLFVSQVPTGLEIVDKVFQFTVWP
jgi:hypothetical protein